MSTSTSEARTILEDELGIKIAKHVLVRIDDLHQKYSARLEKGLRIAWRKQTPKKDSRRLKRPTVKL
eukprot:3078938-Pleurochrysis_carterae.AAC.1